MLEFRTFRLILLSLALTTQAGQSHAKPLISNSEQTFESICLDFGDTPDRLIEICGNALTADAASEAQRLEMMATLGWALGQVGDKEAARQVYEDMRAIDPMNPDAFLGIAWQSHEVDAYDEAVTWFQMAMEVRPEEEALAGLASSLNRSGQKTLDEVLPLIDAALAIDPDYGWAWREKAWLMMEDGRTQASIEIFQKALELDPDDGYAHYGLAYAYSETDDWDAALLAVNRSLQSLPDFVTALSRRSLILLYLDRPAQALRDAERLIEMAPDNSDGYVRAARAQADLGWTGKAVATLDQATKHIGYEAYLYYWRAKMLDRADRPEEALTMLAEVFSHGDADYYDYSLRSSLLIDAKDYGAARDAIDIGLADYPEAAWLMFYDAVVMIHEKTFEDAELRFDAAVEAGLPDTRLPYFLKHLTGAAQYVQAVQMRVRYADLAQADDDSN